MNKPAHIDNADLAHVTGGLIAGGPGCVLRKPQYPRDFPRGPWPNERMPKIPPPGESL